MKNWFLLLSTIVAASGCSSPYKSSVAYSPLDYSGFHLQGKIIEGRYYDPAGYFSVAVMENGYGLKINESVNKAITAVAFQNEIGDLVQVEVIPGFKTEIEKRAISEDMKNIFEVLVVRQMNDIFLDAEVLKVEEREIEGLGNVCLALVSIPEGATIGDKLTGKQADTTRAYLLTFQKEHLVVISKQEVLFPTNPVMQSILNIDTRQKDEMNNALLNKVIKIGKTYRAISHDESCSS